MLVEIISLSDTIKQISHILGHDAALSLIMKPSQETPFCHENVACGSKAVDILLAILISTCRVIGQYVDRDTLIAILNRR